MSRGRPPSIESHLIINTLLKHKDEILETEIGSFVSEKNSIWENLSKELSNTIKAASIYSYVVNDRFNLKELLLGKNDDVANKTSVDSNLTTYSSTISDEESDI